MIQSERTIEYTQVLVTIDSPRSDKQLQVDYQTVNDPIQDSYLYSIDPRPIYEHNLQYDMCKCGS